MKSAGIRKHHRRIQHQARVDHHDQQERIFKQKDHVSTFQQVITLSILATLFGKISSYIGRYVDLFLRIPSLNLDLTKSSPFDKDRSRDAGAWYLRGLFPALGTMVSTRDGKIIR